MPATIYLIPSNLSEDNFAVFPMSILAGIKSCDIFFVENKRTTRRFFKKLWNHFLPSETIIIDNYEWYEIGENTKAAFRQKIKEQQTIGLVSEAGCPGVADPGQSFIALAHEYKATIKPLVGPSSILLALMGSGMNGQQFQFLGYLPIDKNKRTTAIQQIESASAKNNCTQIFIETPYRNNALLQSLMETCKDKTRMCIAVNLTGSQESIQTKTIKEWKKNIPDIHKQPAIFLLHSDANN
ncbi:MAG: SAM-dependent methyltransferase [Chitinophagaceae bacterium]|nr:SAM-dependent methyltransferase [Chitinophagaceae bacterium]